MSGLVNFIARLSLRRDASVRQVKSDFDGILKSLDQIEQGTERVRELRTNMLVTLRTSLDLVSVVQMTRFAMKDLQDLASGRGGIQDVLSITTTLILLTYRLIQLQRQAIMQGGILATVGLTGPQAAALAVGAGIIAGLAGMTQATRGAQSRQREIVRRRLANLRARGG